MSLFIIFMMWFFLYKTFLMESLIGFMFLKFESTMTEMFFLNSKENENIHLFFSVYFFLFFSLIMGLIPFNKNELLFILFYLAFLLWFSGFINNLKFIFFIEEGGLLSFFMFLLALISILVQPITLSLRIFVNLFLGEVLMLFLYYFNYPYMFFSNIFEFFVIFLQSTVFCFLMLSYKKN